MKLKKVTSNDPSVRKTYSLHQSVLDQIAAYQAFYKAVHGDDIGEAHLIEEIVKAFVTEDKDFQKFLSTYVPPAVPAGASETAERSQLSSSF